MAKYEPVRWKDHVVERPNTYAQVVNPDGTVTQTEAPGEIIQQGTIMSASNLNHMDDALAEHINGTGNPHDTRPDDITVFPAARGEIATLDWATKGVPIPYTAQIISTQSGSGDPSPSNVRPIVGRSSMVFTRCGLNLARPVFEDTHGNGITRTQNADGTSVFNGTSGTDGSIWPVLGLFQVATEVLPLSGKTLTISGGSANIYFQLTYYDTDAGEFTAKQVYGGTLTFEVPDNCIVTRVNYGANAGRTANNEVAYGQIEIGDTARQYVAYKDNKYTITPPYTMGGTPALPTVIDAKSGKMSRCWAVLTLAGTEAWTREGTSDVATNGYRMTLSPSVPAKIPASPSDMANVRCSHLVNTSSVIQYGGSANNSIAVASSGLIAIYSRSYNDTVAAWQAYLAAQKAAGSPVQIMYEVDAPPTVGAVSIPALEGVNSIWHDGGGDTIIERVSMGDILRDFAEMQAEIASLLN